MTSSKSRWAIAALVAALLAVVVLGAIQLSFLCDDAFITFRYVSNARDGLGLVWNPPPFQPVEGYTSFLWALLLWAAWSWCGVEPPAAANVLSIGCGVLEFLLLAAAALRLQGRGGARLPAAIGLLALAAIAGNRSFLQWMTSGLETSLWNLTFVAWVLLAFRSAGHRSTRWLLAWSAAAAAAALTRPDGLLLVATTGAVALLSAWRRQRPFAATAAGLLPLLAVIVHVGWRRLYYGEWLPNTYYAKVVGAWPEAGLRYFGCFALEHGVWLWIPLALVWLAVEAKRAAPSWPRLLLNNAPAVAAVGCSLFHCAYYVLQVGGDHFEYRVFSHVVPLAILAAAAMAARLSDGVRAPIAAIAGLWLASGLGWLHLAVTSDRPANGFRAVAPSLPEFVRPLARWFDRQQAWLLFRNIGLRCDHHRTLLGIFQRDFPHRMWVDRPPDPFPAFPIGAVGVSGWSLPNCVLLDLHGLNDWVVARTPVQVPGDAMSSERLRPLIAAADVQKDGFLDAAELRAAIGLLGGGSANDEAGDQLVTILLAIYAHQRDDALSIAEAEVIGDELARVRSMAHERHPPPGYVEAFEPNVVAQHGVATARPRRVPLTAERIRAIEAEWRAKVLEGRAR